MQYLRFLRHKITPRGKIILALCPPSPRLRTGKQKTKMSSEPQKK